MLVASDCSADATDDIVREFAEHGVTLVRVEERKGKEYAQSQAIAAATGEVLVFSDVSTEIPAGALRTLVGYFSDPDVGAVSSEDRFVSASGEVAGEGAYVRYEMWLRRLESRRAGLVGLSGSFFAARREICAVWDIESPSDFNTALNCARAGKVAVTAPDVLGYYADLQDPAREYQRKLRTIIRGLTALSRQRWVLGGVNLFSFQVWSHKVMRWAVPWCMVGLLVASLALVGRHGFFTLAAVAQLAVYGVVVWVMATGQQLPGVLRLPVFFVQVNLAILHATLRYLSGQRMTTWTPSQR